MRRFVGSEIKTFLKAVDANLAAPFRVVVIGGAAASLAFQSDRGTRDIDTINDSSPIRKAIEAAARATGLQIPVSPAGVWDGPYEYEDRLRRVRIRGLKRLQVFVPEVHDWVLMKSMRADERDLQAVKDVASRKKLDRRLLCDRFTTEMTHVMGAPKRIEGNFLAMIEYVFGVQAADDAERRIRRRT